MKAVEEPVSEIKTLSKRLAKSALHLGENRLQLLFLELEEERERLIEAALLVVGLAVFGLLAGVSLTIVVLLIFRDRYPLLAMALLTVLYAGTAFAFYSRLIVLRRDWKAFSGTLSQLREDCSCLAQIL